MGKYKIEDGYELPSSSKELLPLNEMRIGDSIRFECPVWRKKSVRSNLYQRIKRAKMRQGLLYNHFSVNWCGDHMRIFRVS